MISSEYAPFWSAFLNPPRGVKLLFLICIPLTIIVTTCATVAPVAREVAEASIYLASTEKLNPVSGSPAKKPVETNIVCTVKAESRAVDVKDDFKTRRAGVGYGPSKPLPRAKVSK